MMGHHGQESQLQQLQAEIDTLNVSIANQRRLNDEKDISIVYSTTGMMVLVFSLIHGRLNRCVMSHLHGRIMLTMSIPGTLY